MIVECKQCQTRFRMADEKISPQGVKVRCSKCQHTFLVKREDPAPSKQAEEQAKPVEDDGLNAWPKAPTMQLFAVSPSDVNKAAAAASAPHVEKTEINPASDFTATVQAPNPFLSGPASAEQKLANEKTEVSDPFSLHSAPVLQRQAAEDPFGFPSVPPEAASPPAAELKNPFVMPAPATTADTPAALASQDPFAISPPPPPSADLSPSLQPDPFALAAPAQGGTANALPVSDPFAMPAPSALGDTPDALPVSDPFAIASVSPAAAQSEPVLPPDPFAMPPPPSPAPVNAAAVGPDPFSSPPGPEAMGDPLAPPPGAAVASANDLFAGLGLPMDAAPDGLPFEQDDHSVGFADADVEAKTRVRTVDDDMLQMLASYSQSEQEQQDNAVLNSSALVKKEKNGTTDSVKDASSMSSWIAHSLQGVAGLTVAFGVLLLLYHFRGGQFADFSPNHLFNVVMFGELGQVTGDLSTRAVEVQSYPVNVKQRRILVLGEVENKGQHAVPAVLVSATLFAKDGSELEQAQAYAGTGVSPFDLRRSVTGAEVKAKTLKTKTTNKQPLAVDQRWPFVVAFTSPTDKALGGKVQVTLRAADAVQKTVVLPKAKTQAGKTKNNDLTSDSKKAQSRPPKRSKSVAIEYKKAKGKKSRKTKKTKTTPNVPPPPPPPPAGL